MALLHAHEEAKGRLHSFPRETRDWAFTLKAKAVPVEPEPMSNETEECYEASGDVLYAGITKAELPGPRKSGGGLVHHQETDEPPDEMLCQGTVSVEMHHRLLCSTMASWLHLHAEPFVQAIGSGQNPMRR